MLRMRFVSSIEFSKKIEFDLNISEDYSLSICMRSRIRPVISKNPSYSGGDFMTNDLTLDPKVD